LEALLYNRGPAIRISHTEFQIDNIDPTHFYCAIINVENGLPDSGPMMKKKGDIITRHYIGIVAERGASHREFPRLQNIEDNEGSPRADCRSSNEIRLGKSETEMSELLLRFIGF
jgi:hypothetical protein